MAVGRMCVLLSCGVIVAFLSVLLPYLTRVEYRVHHSGNVLITGASTGIGRSAALRLLSEGYYVYAGVRKSGDGQKLSADAGSNAARLLPVILDVTRPAEADAVVEVLKASGRPLVALVNCAGVSLKKPLETAAIADVRWLFDVNLFGGLELTQKLLPSLRASEGRIINVGSVAGIVALPLSGIYSASKYALEALSDALRLELAPWRISVSMVNPGYVVTPILAKSGAHAENRSETEELLYSSVLSKAVEKSRKQQSFGSACCAVTDDDIAHAVRDAFPLTRYYPAVVAPYVPASVIVPLVRLLGLPSLDRLADRIKLLF